MIAKGKKRITITLPKKTYEALIICCNEAKISKSTYIKLSLNSTVNWELWKEKRNDKSKK